MKKTKKILAYLLCAVMLLTGSAFTALAADYSAQGVGGQTLTMLSPSDITVTSDDTYYSNTINTVLDCSAEIVFNFTFSAGMKNYSDELFVGTNLPLISVFDTYGGTEVTKPIYVSGSSDGIFLSIPANTLSDGTYYLVFDENIQSNNADKILGKDIVFAFTVAAGADSGDEQDDGTGDDDSSGDVTIPYTDVPNWATNYVAAVIENGCMSGLSDTSFGPDVTVTRGEFVIILGKARGINSSKYTESVFADINSSDSCSAYAAWALQKELVFGYGDNMFGPDDVLTREQIVTILYRYAVVFAMDTSAVGSLSAFSDGGQVSAWANEAMVWAIGDSIISGYGNGTLCPQNAATRVQVAKLIAVLVLTA